MVESIDSEALCEQLALLRARMERLTTFRRRRSIALAVGVLLLAGVIGVFVHSIVAQSRVLYDELNSDDVRERLLAELAEDPVVQRELDDLGEQLLMDVLPRVAGGVIDELRAAGPELRSAAKQSGLRLSQRAQQRIRDAFPQAVTGELRAVEAEVRTAYPGFTADAFAHVMRDDAEALTGKVDEVAVSRLALAVFHTLRARLELQDFAAEHSQLSVPVEDAEDALIDALLELVAFELAPAVGQEPAPR